MIDGLKKKNKKIFSIIQIIILLIATGIIVASFYTKSTFPMTSIEELYFYYNNGVQNSDSGVFISAIKFCLPYALLLFVILCALFFDLSFGHLKLKKTIHKKNKENKVISFYPVNIIINHRIIANIILVICSMLFVGYCFKSFTFLKDASTNSTFIEKNYVDPKKTDVKFNKKRNLVVLFVESLETSFFTKKQGGYWNYEVTPELYKLLKEKDSIAFHDKNSAQQMSMIEGASWTTASVVTNNTGIPFKIPIGSNDYHSKNFMNGSYALGDMLKDEGYHNEVISGATTSFGGIKEFYTRHGKYDIIDTDTLNNYGFKMKEKDKGAWGFNDKYMFDIAKKRLKKISKSSQPFNLQIISIDNHFPDGFVGDYTLNKYKTQYENVYATDSKLIYDFVSWIKKQDFYKDTTILVVGDHVSMQTGYFASRGITNRYVYSCLINSDLDAKKENNRIYSALDTYPTLISAIGGQIKGDRLGLGVNMLSSKQTLTEQYGFALVNGEVKKNSDFYNKKILADDYDKMIEDGEE